MLRDLRTFLGLAACLTAATIVSSCSSAAWKASPAARKAQAPVLLISLDGLRPDFYRPGSGWDAPNLQALAARGATASSAEPVYPTVTYVNHATLMTGVYADRHGVLSNTVFSSTQGSTAEWYWDARHVSAPTLWQRAEAAGYKTAILTWPATVGARATWVIPEIFASPPFASGSTWALMRERMDPALVRELESISGGLEPEGFGPRDQWLTLAAAHVLKQARPDFAMTHIIALDKAEHDFGMNAPEVKAALKIADEQLGRILAAVDPAHTIVILTGDHGFHDFDKLVRPATLWAGEKWASQVVVHPAGGSAAVYVRGSEPFAATSQAKLIKLLKSKAGKAYRILSREELDRLHAFPGALLAIDPITRMPDGSPGYSVSPQTSGPFIEKLPKPKGNHGALASDDPALMTGFIAAGPGIAPGTRLGHVRLLDVAPTVASLLGFPFPEAQGHPIELGVHASAKP